MSDAGQSQNTGQKKSIGEMLGLAGLDDRKKKMIAGGAVGVAALFAVLQFAIPGGENGDPSAQSPVEQNVTDGRAYADELRDYGVAAQSSLQSNVGSPTPLDIPGATRVTTEQVANAILNGEAILVDVLANPHPQTLAGAYYVPNGGAPGNFNDQAQSALQQQLQRIANGNRNAELVFFCASASCWESYNAALRAQQAGYTQVKWYRGGLASWAEAGFPMSVTPTANSGQAAQSAQINQTSTESMTTNSQFDAEAEIDVALRAIYANYGPTGSGSFDIGEFLTQRAISHLQASPELLDPDPVCQCQDWDEISIRSIELVEMGTSDAAVIVEFQDTFGSARRVGYLFMHERGYWKIDNLTRADGSMLLPVP